MSTETAVSDRVRAYLDTGKARSVCPYCTASHEESFVVRQDSTNPALFWYQCYRAACGARGRFSDADGLRLSAARDFASRTDDVNPFHNAPPPTEEQALMFAKYGVSRETMVRAGVRWNSDHGELALPIYNRIDGRNKLVGWQTRIPPKDGKRIRTSYFVPQTVERYQYTLYNPRALAARGVAERVVVVENPLSALRIAQVAPDAVAVALLGHVLASRTAGHLRSQELGDFLVLLDPDTWPGPVTAVLRVLESAGIPAEARYIPFKPYELSGEELKELMT